MGLLENKVAIVTGAGSGIGRASSLVMAREGASVVVTDVDELGGAETVDMIGEAGGAAAFVRADVTDEDDIVRMLAAAVEIFGGLDCAHNNAGVSGDIAPIVDYERAEWDRVLTVNVTGVWLCMKHQIRLMLGRGGGAIVNTSSTFGNVGCANLSGYVASKHAVAGLTRAAALECAPAGIRVNAVCPGVTDTPLLRSSFAALSPDAPEAAEALFVAGEPLGRMAAPREIGEAVAWLCSDAASFVTGVAMPIDGGWLAQ